MRPAILIAATLGLIGAAPARPLLLPVSDRDIEQVKGMGCESAFVQKTTSYTFMRNSSFLLRTAPGRAGLHLCEFTDAQTDGFGEGAKQLACGGRRVAIRRIGRVTSYPEADSADFPAELSVTDGIRRATLRGRYGTAC